MDTAVRTILPLLFIVWCAGCDILSSSTPTLTGTWDIEILTMEGPSTGVLDLEDHNGRLAGSFTWHGIFLPITGTAGNDGGIDMEMRDDIHRCLVFGRMVMDRTIIDASLSHYEYVPAEQATVFRSGGSFTGQRRGFARPLE